MSVLPSPLLCFFFLSPLLSKHKEVRILAAVYFFFRLTCTSQRHKLVSAKMFSMFSAKTSDVFTFYMAWGREKATLNPIWPVRLKRISRNVIWIGFQTTYECSSKRICTNRISCSSLPFRLFKYDWISIGFAQKLDLGWQSERGLMLCHAFWLIYTAKELDSHAKHDQSLKKLVGNMTDFCAKDTPSGFVYVLERFFFFWVWSCMTS